MMNNENQSSNYEDAISKIDPNFFVEPIPEKDVFEYEKEYNNNIGSTQITEKLRTNSNKTKNEIEIYEVKKNNDKKTNGIIESKGYDGNGGCCNDEINCFVF